MKTFTQIMTTGTHKEQLEALRDKISEEIEAGVPARDLASLSLRLTNIVDALNEMDDGEGESSADRIARERAERRAGAANSTARESTAV